MVVCGQITVAWVVTHGAVTTGAVFTGGSVLVSISDGVDSFNPGTLLSGPILVLLVNSALLSAISLVTLSSE